VVGFGVASGERRHRPLSVAIVIDIVVVVDLVVVVDVAVDVVVDVAVDVAVVVVVVVAVVVGVSVGVGGSLAAVTVERCCSFRRQRRGDGAGAFLQSIPDVRFAFGRKEQKPGQT
jgi:hypothetical protein